MLNDQPNDPLASAPYTILLELTPFEASALLRALQKQDDFFLIAATEPIAVALCREGVLAATPTQLVKGAF